MKRLPPIFVSILLAVHIANPALSQSNSAAPSNSAVASASTSVAPEAGANTQAFPRQILRTGVNLTTPGLSPNTMQMANAIGMTPLLNRMQQLRGRIDEGGPITLENLSARQDLSDTRSRVILLIERTDLEIDFTLAEISAEERVYDEILSTFTGNRDKLLARINATSFISNGILWAIAEAYDIPTYKYPRLSIPSGTIGIAAGIVPSIASMYTLRAVNGKKKTSEIEPNMLAKLFGYPTTVDIDYPHSVWDYLNQVPADDPKGKKRLDQLVDRWIADSNMPAFTNRSSKEQLDVLTASVAQRKGLTISMLSARQTMLNQLNSEILKMKRMLLELAMAAQGDKQFTAAAPEPEQKQRIGAEPAQQRNTSFQSVKELADREQFGSRDLMMMNGIP